MLAKHGNAPQQPASVIGRDWGLILSRNAVPSKLVFALKGELPVGGPLHGRLRPRQSGILVEHFPVPYDKSSATGGPRLGRGDLQRDLPITLQFPEIATEAWLDIPRSGHHISTIIAVF
jgi:hypothetical protein